MKIDTPTAHAFERAEPAHACAHELVQAIGLDLGGTKLHAGSVDAHGRLGRERLEASSTTSESALFAQLQRVARTLRDARPDAVLAIGAPGAVDQSTGMLASTPNIPLSPHRALGRSLEEALGFRVLVENDVNLAALAEARAGAGRGAGLVCFLSFGTGVGLGIVNQGRILSGARGRAGEISHLPLPAGTAWSEAGLFEDRVGTRAIRAAYGRDGVDVRTIFARAAAGEAAALDTIEAVAAVAARGLVSLQVILDPDLVVIGGGIGARKPFRDALARNAAQLSPFALSIVPPRLGQAAGMIGAVMLACDAAGLPQPALPERGADPTGDAP